MNQFPVGGCEVAVAWVLSELPFHQVGDVDINGIFHRYDPGSERNGSTRQLDRLLLSRALVCDHLKDIEKKPNYHFERGDILDLEFLATVFSKYRIDGVIHLAAESHVDRSLHNPTEFANTNIIGTLTLLRAAQTAWHTKFEGKTFYHISTDEVYGSAEHGGYFTEQTPVDPRSPYSASKASSDHFVRAYHDTYGLPVVITNCSNNYGPYHFPEKLIPLFINNIICNFIKYNI